MSSLRGLVFVSGSGDEYGIIRLTENQEKHPVSTAGFEYLADDEMGNAFALTSNGRILFWDHETDEATVLATSWDEFVAGCAAPKPVELDERGTLRMDRSGICEGAGSRCPVRWVG